MVSITDALIHFPIVLVASLWVHQWSAKRVELCSDNTAVVEVLRSGTLRDSNLMVLLRHLSLLAARHSFVFTVCHVPGKSNRLNFSGSISKLLMRLPQQHQYLLWYWPDGCIVQRGVTSSISVVSMAMSVQIVLCCPLMNKPCCVLVPT